MDDELENFLRERRARVAEDKARLEQDPPYMEMKEIHHRVHGSTAKENIPPKSLVRGKEESISVGLPLGVEYERKKQKLQQELRMDYRRYMAEKKQHIELGPLSKKHVKLEDQAGAIPKQRPTSRRDAATLTEASRALYRPLNHLEVKNLCSEEEQPLARPRHYDRLGSPVDQETEEEYRKEQLELMGRRLGRHPGTQTSFDNRRSKKTDGRGNDHLVGAKDGRRSRPLTKNEDEEFATGLIIGVLDTEDTLQRRKERYREELQEQIAEQHRNKKREKELEMKVAATGANDPEKQPDRIRQFGLCRKKARQVLDSSARGEIKTSFGGPAINEKMGVRDRDIPPPEQPQVAFQSPLLEYSSLLEGGTLSPNSQPAAHSYNRAMDIPRVPLFPPHPPPTLNEAYRSQYAEPHHYYGIRNLNDPTMAYYNHLSVPVAGPLMSYWNVPPGGAVTSQFGNNIQNTGNGFPEPPIKAGNDKALDAQVKVFSSERSSSARERIVSYREALKQQIVEQQERRLLEREEAKRYEAQLEVDMKKHEPWGRGGGGAPLRDGTGNLIADLNHMHKLNEEAYSNPKQRQSRAAAAMRTHRAEVPETNERASGFAHVQNPQFARGNVFANQPTQQQLQEQDKYKAYLKHQIEEKMRIKAEEKERIQLEEDKAEKRLAEQRARIQREYEGELDRKRKKEMEQRAKNEELIYLADQKRKETERKKREAEEENILRRQYEKERQAHVEKVHREPSPPIPTLQRKHGPHQNASRPPTVDSQHSIAHLSERSLSVLQSPPITSCRDRRQAAGDQRDVFSALSALRRHLRSEQKRMEDRFQRDDREELESSLSNGQHERPLVDVFDMARLRRQVPVQRRNSRTVEPRNLERIHDSLQLKHPDDEAGLDSEVHKLREGIVASRRRPDYVDPYHPFSSQRSTAHDEYFNTSPPQQNDYLRSVMGRSARGSLLESDSAFIDTLGDALPVPHTPEFEKNPTLSVKERRQAKQPQHRQHQTAFSQSHGQHDDYTGSRQQQEADGHRGNTAGTVDLSDDDSISTDAWLRPGTSDTLKCLDRPSRRGRLIT